MKTAPTRQVGRYVRLKKHVYENYKRGDRLPSEGELASEIGISRYATLKALHELSAEGFIRREQGRGTFVTGDQQLRFSKNNVKGTVAFLADEFESNDIVEILRGAEEGCRAESFGVALLNSNFNHEVEISHLRHLTNNGYSAAIILISGYEASTKELERLIEEGFPFVLIDVHFDNIDCPGVEIDNEKAAYEAVKYLIGLGHRKIAHMTGGISAKKRISSVKEREAGYCRALTEAGIPVRDEYICHSEILSIDEYPTPQTLKMMSYVPMHKMLSLPEPPSGVFLVNDMWAAGAHEAIVNHGLSVPKDISLISIGSDTVPRDMPISLTKMIHPARTIGKRSVNLLKHIMAGKELEDKLVKINANLLVQSSTARVVSI